ncbi:MAG: hypothetical protein IKJ11_10215 [Clostridia bacterium]|nr:hypothetical protein [Clostridia bacterium]
MSDNLQIYLAIIAFGFVVTMLRLWNASSESKDKQQAAQRNKSANDQQLDFFVQQNGGHADEVFSTSCAAAALDRTQGMLYVVCGSHEKYSLKDLSAVKLVDMSEEYQNVQKLEQLHSGVDRGSTMNPYRGHSMREVKDAHQRFQSWQGNIVYGMELQYFDNRTPVTVDFFRADGDVFWLEAQNLSDCRQFVGAVEHARWNGK